MEMYKPKYQRIYIEFLNKFTSKYTNTTIPDSNAFPKHNILKYITEDELSNEIMDWTLQHLLLEITNCPLLLRCMIAQRVSENAKKWNLSPYLESVDKQPNTRESASSEHYDASVEGQSTTTDTTMIDTDRLLSKIFAEILLVSNLMLSQNCIQLLFQSPVPCVHQTYDVSVSSMRNGRRKMEDKHIVMPYFSQLFDLDQTMNSSFYAVLDGHGGNAAVEYATKHVYAEIARHYTDYHKRVKNEEKVKVKWSAKEAMTIAFNKVDTRFCKRAKKEKLRSGTTVVCALIESFDATNSDDLSSTTLTLGWCGDSQAVLVRNGQPQKIMSPHTPEREDEIKRIKSLGGLVLWNGVWRVNGILAVSRAIGDVSFKPYVTSIPDTMQTPIYSCNQEPSTSGLSTSDNLSKETLNEKSSSTATPSRLESQITVNRPASPSQSKCSVDVKLPITPTITTSTPIINSTPTPTATTEEKLNRLHISNDTVLDDYIVLACDGIWDVITFDVITKTIFDHLVNTGGILQSDGSVIGGDRENTAQTVIKLAVQNGSKDNITIIIVFIKNIDQAISSPISMELTVVQPINAEDSYSSATDDYQIFLDNNTIPE